jgi:hypothetical protein
VYVTGRGNVRVLDFNPWGGATLPLLFTWAELASIDGARARARADSPCVLRCHPGTDAIVLCVRAATEGADEEEWPAVRIVDSPQAIRPGLRTGVPLELYDTSAGSALQDFISRHRGDAVPGGSGDNDNDDDDDA